MLHTADNPVSIVTIVAILAAALLAAGVAARRPRTGFATLPLLYLWTRWAEYPVGYSSDAHVIPFRIALLLPIAGILVGIAIRHRRGAS